MNPPAHQPLYLGVGKCFPNGIGLPTDWYMSAGRPYCLALPMDLFIHRAAQERLAMACKQCVYPGFYVCSGAWRGSKVTFGVFVLLAPWVSRL